MRGTPVYFCKFEDEITAVLVNEPANLGNFLCYAHVGQHGECSIQWVYEDTEPATPEEYSDLLDELEYIGYDDVYDVGLEDI